MKRPKTCLFCGTKGNISKEHLWPQWLAAHLRTADSAAHVSEFYGGEAKHPISLLRRSERQGPVVTKKIRAVCIACNSTWMSAAETKVKPIILDLIEARGTLSIEAALSLAYWVALKSIVGEHASEDAALTPVEERRSLHQSQIIPPFFRIFVAPHALQTDSAYYRHSTTISAGLTGPSPALPKGISRNIQATTFLVGALCFYVTAIRATGINPRLLDPKLPMHRIWPAPEQPVVLESQPPLGPVQVYLLSRSLERLIQRPTVRYGGPLQRPGQDHS